MFTKYLIVVDANVNVHNTSEALFHLTANTDPQRRCNHFSSAIAPRSPPAAGVALFEATETAGRVC